MKKTFTSGLAMMIALCITSSVRAADIVDTAVAAGKFKTLAAALDFANLFVVFQPGSEAVHLVRLRMP